MILQFFTLFSAWLLLSLASEKMTVFLKSLRATTAGNYCGPQLEESQVAVSWGHSTPCGFKFPFLSWILTSGGSESVKAFRMLHTTPFLAIYPHKGKMATATLFLTSRSHTNEEGFTLNVVLTSMYYDHILQWIRNSRILNPDPGSETRPPCCRCELHTTSKPHLCLRHLRQDNNYLLHHLWCQLLEAPHSRPEGRMKNQLASRGQGRTQPSRCHWHTEEGHSCAWWEERMKGRHSGQENWINEQHRSFFFGGGL